jgi:phosphate butyryltransferase
MDPIRDFDDLRLRAAESIAARKPLRAILAPADDPLGLEGLNTAAQAGLVVPLLAGENEKIQAAAAQARVDVSGWKVIPAASPEQAVREAAREAASGMADVILCGRMEPRAFVQIMCREDAGLKSKGLVSHVGLFHPAALGRFLLVSDAFVNVDPDLEAMPEIIGHAVRAARALGMEKPRVALLSGVELVYPSMAVAIGGAVLAKMSDRGQIPGALVDGPLSLDAALYPEVARDKKVTGEVAGRADAVVTNRIEAGYALYQSIALFGRTESAGLLMGLKVPVVLNSRAESASSRMLSLALAALLAVK